MIFYGAFRGMGNQHYLGHASGGTFFHNKLNEGFVHQRQHFLRNGFSGRQHARTYARDRDDDFFYCLLFHTLSPFYFFYSLVRVKAIILLVLSSKSPFLLWIAAR